MRNGQLIFFILVFSGFVGFSVADQAVSDKTQQAKNYKFTTDWFSINIPTWENVLKPYKNQAKIKYLEIGVYEGRSFFWMMDNILTHPTARATAIDCFPDDLFDRFMTNSKISGCSDRITILSGMSDSKLRELYPSTFDIIYVDAGHTADHVLEDTVLSWPLLKPGGILILDDYLLDKQAFPVELRPEVSIDAFITAYRNYLEVLYKKSQVVIRKRDLTKLGYLSYDNFFISVGDYSFYPNTNGLYNQKTGERLELASKEYAYLHELINTRGFGIMDFLPTSAMAQDKDFEKMAERLKIPFKNSPAIAK